MSTLRKLGNSAGTIIPASILNEVGFALGDELDIEAEQGRIIIKKASPTYTLEQLLDGVTKEMLERTEEDNNWLNSAVGKECIDD